MTDSGTSSQEEQEGQGGKRKEELEDIRQNQEGESEEPVLEDRGLRQRKVDTRGKTGKEEGGLEAEEEEERNGEEQEKWGERNGEDDVDDVDEESCEENGVEQEKKEDIRPYQRPALMHYLEVPTHLRFNKYVLTHYRPPMDVTGCIASLTYFHNETINIITHAVPVILVAAAVPWMLPWEEISVPWLPCIHVFACVAPWIGSTLYHLFMCHKSGEAGYTALLKIDLLGIWFTQTFGALVTICAATHCLEYDTKFWLLIGYSLLCFMCLYQAMTVSTVWGRRFAFSAPFSIRMACLLLRLSSWGGGAPNTTFSVIMQDLLAVLGAYIGAVNIPEKWFPGQCDLLCNSHNIMHVLVVIAVYQMHQAARLDLVWMSSSASCTDVPRIL